MVLYQVKISKFQVVLILRERERETWCDLVVSEIDYGWRSLGSRPGQVIVLSSWAK